MTECSEHLGNNLKEVIEVQAINIQNSLRSVFPFKAAVINDDSFARCITLVGIIYRGCWWFVIAVCGYLLNIQTRHVCFKLRTSTCVGLDDYPVVLSTSLDS